MSLLTYEDARPWTESIREELIAERMPPWHVDPVGSAPVAQPRSGGALTAREVDTIVVWVTGGTPEGDPSKRPATAVPVGVEWRAGTPDATITMPAPATVPADRQDDTREFVLATGIADTRWLKGVDLLPGTPSMVHDAIIGIEGGQELAVWTPGDSPTMLAAGAAVRLDAGRKLTLRIHYKKSWRDERTARSDRSTIGLYFAAAPAGGREVRIMQADAAPTTQPLTLLGIRPTDRSRVRECGRRGAHALRRARSPAAPSERSAGLAEALHAPEANRAASRHHNRSQCRFPPHPGPPGCLTDRH